MPDPAILFLWLCVGVILLSQVLCVARRQGDLPGRRAAAGAARRRPTTAARPSPVYVAPNEQEPADDYQVETETTEVQGLLTVDGIRFLFTSFVDNFRNFAAVAIILVVMIGVGLAEAAGLIGALIRRLVAVSSSGTLTFIIVLLGMISSVASDAGYLVLIPLGAVGVQERRAATRSPGIAAAFAGVAAGFGVNFLITPLDGVLTEITNDASALVDPNARDRPRGEPLLRDRLGAVRHDRARRSSRRGSSRAGCGTYDPADAGDEPRATSRADAAEDEARGLRYALWATLGVIVVIALLTVIPGAPLQDPETGRVIGDSPFMDSLIVIIALIFFAAGLAYGHGAGTIKGSAAVLGLDHQVLGRAGEPAVPVPADRAVHRLLQLLEHGAGRRRAARRRARASRTSAPSGC